MKPVWKTGSLVQLGSIGLMLRVVGCDSAGSVICELLDEAAKRERLYVTPSLLIGADLGKNHSREA